MAPIHSKDSVFFLGKYALINYLTSVEPTSKQDKADVSVLGRQYEESIPGQFTGSLKCQGFADYAVGASHEAVAAYRAQTVPATFSAPGTTTGDTAVMINGYVDTSGEKADNTSALGLEFSLESTESVDYGVLLEPQTTLSVTGAGTVVDNNAASTTGWAANLHIPAGSGTSPTITVKIQHSTDNSTYTDLCTFTAATGPTYEHKSGSGTVNRYVKAIWTIGGTGPSFSVAVSFARR